MVRIVTDSSSNITPEEAEELGVTVIPLTVIFGSDELRDGVDITAEAFYDRLARDKNHPHTSQINTAQFEEIFRDAQAKGEKLILLPISAALSGTHAAAVKAKENVGYDGIYVYDTRTTTVMLKMLVLEARRLADREPEEIISALDDLRSRTELYAMVDTLEYLWKGGRMARGTAMLGGLFRVKPIITIKSDGSLDVVAKAIGTRSAIKNLRKFVNPETILHLYRKQRQLRKAHKRSAPGQARRISLGCDQHLPRHRRAYRAGSRGNMLCTKKGGLNKCVSTHCLLR